MSTISLYTRLDLSDVFDEISDAQLVEELEKRNRSVVLKVAEADMEIVPFMEEALELLRSGRADDAALALERTLYPKWKSPDASLAQLRKVAS